MLGHHFVIRTNHGSLKHLTDLSIQTPDQQKWLCNLLGFDFHIEYKLRKENIATDGLSRSLRMSWFEPKSIFLQIVREVVKKDNKLLHQLEACLSNTNTNPNYFAKKGLLYWKKIVVVHVE